MILGDGGKIKAYPMFTDDPVRSVETFYIEFDLGCYRSSDKHDNGVAEHIFVLRGALRLVLGDRPVEVSEGQAMTFPVPIRTSPGTGERSTTPYSIQAITEDVIMYELIQASERSYYIQSPAKIGPVRLAGQGVCLIDSGNDKDAGRKVRQILDTNGWRLTAIYNTHSNAGHIGGNRYLQGQTGCKIYAPGIDCAFARHPILEPPFFVRRLPV